MGEGGRGTPAPRLERPGGPPTGERPGVSVIVPAHRATGVLPRSLRSLLASDLEREAWELIVVVDGDSMGRDDDRTAEVAAEHADVVVRLPGKPRGPSYARNRGAELARGELLVFIDADTCVHRDALRRFVELFERRPELDAAFGSYDDRPEAPGIVSKYRNLLHHHVHSANPGEAETFWAACGAIRAEVFHDVGMYDEWHFSQPQIEDIELGRRLRRRGHLIVLDPSIRVCHLKRWTLADVLETDLRHRGVPWTRLILHEGPSPAGRTLNVRPVHRWCVVLAIVAALGGPAALLAGTPWPAWAALAAVLAIVGLNLGFFRVLWRAGGPLVALAAVPLHVVFYLSNAVSAVSGWLAYFLVGAPQPPPDVAAFDEVGVETWPPVPSRPKESVWYEHGA